ncbi:hypothetical protein JCM6882_004654 [Rhodosporidiobolus microsporus]
MSTVTLATPATASLKQRAPAVPARIPSSAAKKGGRTFFWLAAVLAILVAALTLQPLDLPSGSSRVTNTIMKHPAGPSHIIQRVGTDISEEFHKHHHREGLLGMLESQPNRIWRVGVLEKKEEKEKGRKWFRRR